MSLDIKLFNYLNDDDQVEFNEYFGTAYQDMLVAGKKTLYRLEKYLPEKNFFRLRIILTALIREFQLPPVRYTHAI